MKRFIPIIVFLLMVPVFFVGMACTENLNRRASGGDLTKQDRTVKDFDSVDIGGAFEVVLKQGSQEALTVEAEADMLEKIKTEVKGHTLKIYTDKNCCWDNHGMVIYLTVKELKYMEISGACELKTEGEMKLNDLEMEVSGASEMDLNLSLSKLDLDISGASEITLTGSCGQVYMDASGACELDALNFRVETMTIDGSGASECKVNVTKDLQVDASGATSVKYTGGASVHISTSGASSVNPMN